jgi:hypothetical protein
MSTTFRALCAAMLEAYDDLPCETNWKGEFRPVVWIDEDPFEEARTALAQPGPDELTDEELLEVAAKALGYKSIPSDETCLTAEAGELLAYGRAVWALASQAPTTIEPVPQQEAGNP